MIDLHTHTTESDGTYTPQALMEEAARVGLDAIAITDHDTFRGHDEARPIALELGVNLVCGIELSTAWGTPKEKTVHLLGYWLEAPPTPDFREWLIALQEARRDRNARLADKLQSLGLDITLAEAESLGRNMTGRPHFARLLIRKGYTENIETAFREYLNENGKAYVDREEPFFAEAVRRIKESGGMPSLAHPVRLNKQGAEETKMLEAMVDAGLPAIEVWHSDHSPTDSLRYLKFADQHGLLQTGGSDFHGDIKPHVKLGRGAGNLRIPLPVLERLVAAAR